MPAAPTSTITPLPSSSVTLSRLLVRIRNKMETTRRRTWYELQRNHYYTNPPAIHTTAELATALQHFHVSVSEDELRLLMVSFRDNDSGSSSSSSGGFSFKRLAARLYPIDRAEGWGFDSRDATMSGSSAPIVNSKGVAERPQSAAGKRAAAAAAPAARTVLTSTTSAFPVVFASPSSTSASTTAASLTASSTKPAAAAATRTSTTVSTPGKSTAVAVSTRTSAPLHHPSRYVKQPTAIGRVYTERVYDSSEHESQRTAYIKYVNDGYWTRV